MNVIRCREVPTIIADVLGDEASDDLRASLNAHFGHCSPCADTYDHLSRILDQARATPLAEPSDQYWKGFLPALRRRIAESEPARVPWTSWLSPFAAAAAVMLLALLPPQLVRPPNSSTARLDDLRRFAAVLDPTAVGYDGAAAGASLDLLPVFDDYPTSAATGDIFAFYEYALELSDDDTEALFAALSEDQHG